MIAEGFASVALAFAGAGVPAATPAAGAQLGKLTIPRLGVEQPVFESTSGRVLARGVGHYRQTGLPGGARTVALAAHRVTYGRPFRHLNKLRRNDVVVFRNMRGGTIRYRVYAMRVVDPTAVWVLGGLRTRRLVLTTCHPAGSARYRLVVFAKQVSPGR